MKDAQAEGEDGGAPAGGPRWRLHDARALAWRAWDGEHVVFDAATGATHLLDAAGGAVLHGLLEATASLSGPELLRHLAGWGRAAAPAAIPAPGSEPGADPAESATLQALLAELERIGLVRRERA